MAKAQIDLSKSQRALLRILIGEKIAKEPLRRLFEKLGFASRNQLRSLAAKEVKTTVINPTKIFQHAEVLAQMRNAFNRPDIPSWSTDPAKLAAIVYVKEEESTADFTVDTEQIQCLGIVYRPSKWPMWRVPKDMRPLQFEYLESLKHRRRKKPWEELDSVVFWLLFPELKWSGVLPFDSNVIWDSVRDHFDIDRIRRLQEEGMLESFTAQRLVEKVHLINQLKGNRKRQEKVTKVCVIEVKQEELLDTSPVPHELKEVELVRVITTRAEIRNPFHNKLAERHRLLDQEVKRHRPITTTRVIRPAKRPREYVINDSEEDECKDTSGPCTLTPADQLALWFQRTHHGKAVEMSQMWDILPSEHVLSETEETLLPAKPIMSGRESQFHLFKLPVDFKFVSGLTLTIRPDIRYIPWPGYLGWESPKWSREACFRQNIQLRYPVFILPSLSLTSNVEGFVDPLGVSCCPLLTRAQEFSAWLSKIPLMSRTCARRVAYMENHGLQHPEEVANKWITDRCPGGARLAANARRLAEVFVEFLSQELLADSTQHAAELLGGVDLLRQAAVDLLTEAAAQLETESLRRTRELPAVHQRTVFASEKRAFRRRLAGVLGDIDVLVLYSLLKAAQLRDA
ncbi:MAG: hypothetical protein KVP17_000012 [Porospora cf. gigantea B]|nr:MAG: hypothetical protein KVP17_000012 [Porospora cf. gigantea B]